MCTVSWAARAGGYDLFFNRDERHSRRPALAPRRLDVRGVRCLAPADGDFGGTWVGVNEDGLTLALLNRYGVPTDPRRAYTSRGLLVLDLLDSRSLTEVGKRLENMALADYQPFTLAALAPDEPAWVARWADKGLEIENDGDALMPLSSSSFDTERVIEGRRRRFAALAAAHGRVDAGLLLDFHRDHDPEPGAYSVCMHRDDAATVSSSWITVADGQARFVYQPASPCAFDVTPADALTLDLTAQPSAHLSRSV